MKRRSKQLSREPLIHPVTKKTVTKNQQKYVRRSGLEFVHKTQLVRRSFWTKNDRTTVAVQR